MSLSIERFGEFFRVLWGYDSFPWQTRLAKQVFDKGWPECIDLPTASGKTACIDIAVFVLACQAGQKTTEHTVGRRIFFAVNRRVIVDDAFERARTLAQNIRDAGNGILKEVADALRGISGDDKAPPLDIAQLRGGIYRDRAWARSITQPIVICTTADQLGSRLLFRGYGVSPSMQPVHAALTACDSLILLDEAHVTRAFCQTMRLLSKYQGVRTDGESVVPPMRFVQMTATPVNVKDRFELDKADRSHPVIEARQKAPKLATLAKLDKKKSIAEEIVFRASGALSDARKAVGIIVNRVQTARSIYEKLTEKHGANVYLIIGRMRPIDRDDLQKKLSALVGPKRPMSPDVLDKPVVVVATQCLEVGADYDFDVLITECASIDALRQRFGRLNRNGRPIEATAAIVTNEESLKGDDPIYGDAIKHTWEWLWSKRDQNNQVDFGISKFNLLWMEIEEQFDTYLKEDCPKPLLSPTQNAAVLLPAHLDALCQTNPQPVPSPDVSFFIHGPQRNMAEVNVCWRTDLGDDENLWTDIVRLLPPTSPECMTVPLRDLRRWMIEETSNNDRDADVPVLSEDGELRGDRASDSTKRRVVVWRGLKDCNVIDSPNALHPGDTVVIRFQDSGWQQFGHIPGAPRENELKRGESESEEIYAARESAVLVAIDIAERATRQSKLRMAIRLHDVFPNRSGLRELRADELRPLLRDLIAKEVADDNDRQRMLAGLNSRFDRHRYESTADESPESKHNEVIVFKCLLDPPPRLALPSVDEDDGEDHLSERDRLISLDDHTEHVVGRIGDALSRLGVNGLESSLRESARLHDLGKADVRFQAMLAGVTPYEAMMRPSLLGKGDGVRRTQAERNIIFERAMYPCGFRHEMLSIELIEHLKLEPGLPHRDLLLHLIAAHHGYARPFAPVCFDGTTDDELRSVSVNGNDIEGSERKTWIPSHRLNSGVAERFWKLTRAHGWWGLAWLESILRLADQQASAAEQNADPNGGL